MFKEKIKELVSKSDDGNNKKKIEKELEKIKNK